MPAKKSMKSSGYGKSMKSYTKSKTTAKKPSKSKSKMKGY